MKSNVDDPILETLLSEKLRTLTKISKNEQPKHNYYEVQSQFWNRKVKSEMFYESIVGTTSTEGKYFGGATQFPCEPALSYSELMQKKRLERNILPETQLLTEIHSSPYLKTPQFKIQSVNDESNTVIERGEDYVAKRRARENWLSKSKEEKQMIIDCFLEKERKIHEAIKFEEEKKRQSEEEDKRKAEEEKAKEEQAILLIEKAKEEKKKQEMARIQAAIAKANEEKKRKMKKKAEERKRLIENPPEKRLLEWGKERDRYLDTIRRVELEKEMLDVTFHPKITTLKENVIKGDWRKHVRNHKRKNSSSMTDSLINNEQSEFFEQKEEYRYMSTCNKIETHEEKKISRWLEFQRKEEQRWLKKKQEIEELKAEKTILYSPMNRRLSKGSNFVGGDEALRTSHTRDADKRMTENETYYDKSFADTNLDASSTTEENIQIHSSSSFSPSVFERPSNYSCSSSLIQSAACQHSYSPVAHSCVSENASSCFLSPQLQSPFREHINYSSLQKQPQFINRVPHDAIPSRLQAAFPTFVFQGCEPSSFTINLSNYKYDLLQKDNYNKKDECNGGQIFHHNFAEKMMDDDLKTKSDMDLSREYSKEETEASKSLDLEKKKFDFRMKADETLNENEKYEKEFVKVIENKKTEDIKDLGKGTTLDLENTAKCMITSTNITINQNNFQSKRSLNATSEPCEQGQNQMDEKQLLFDENKVGVDISKLEGNLQDQNTERSSGAKSQVNSKEKAEKEKCKNEFNERTEHLDETKTSCTDEDVANRKSESIDYQITNTDSNLDETLINKPSAINTVNTKNEKIVNIQLENSGDRLLKEKIADK